MPPLVPIVDPDKLIAPPALPSVLDVSNTLAPLVVIEPDDLIMSVAYKLTVFAEPPVVVRP